MSGISVCRFLNIVDCPDKDVSEFGTLLFEKAFRNYTSKMWGTDINKIDKYVLERVPFALNYDEHYLNKDSALPAEIISFPQADGKTRSTEYRKIMFEDSNCEGSVVAT